MRQKRRCFLVLLAGSFTWPGCGAIGPAAIQEAAPLAVLQIPLASPAQPQSPVNQNLPAAPVCQPEDRPLPINLPTALQLAHARGVDIAAAAERIKVAAAVLDQARALWLPTITVGGDYFQHAGPVQDVSNAVFNDTHNSLMLGAGTGIGPAAVFTVTDAVFAPLVAKQQLLAGEAKLQAAANDTLVAVTDADFTVQQARGELAGFVDATRRMEDVVARTRMLAPAIVPEFELLRAEAELARRQQAELTARERWKVASADLVRLLRLDTAIQVEPLEPAQLRISLIDVHKPLEELLPIALISRPELASQQAQIQATLAELKQERWRPLLPSLVVRGASTPGSTLAVGGFLPSPNSNVSGVRGDVDVQLLWQLNNLGFGNAALVHQREAENRLALVDMTRIQDQFGSTERWGSRHSAWRRTTRC